MGKGEDVFTVSFSVLLAGWNDVRKKNLHKLLLSCLRSVGSNAWRGAEPGILPRHLHLHCSRQHLSRDNQTLTFKHSKNSFMPL